MKLCVSPSSSLLDEPVEIVVIGANPGGRVRVTASTMDQAGILWRSEGLYDADIQGTVDTARCASVGGTYDGVDANGLLWSMVPALSGDPLQAPSFPVLAPGGLHRIDFAADAAGVPAERLSIDRSWSGAGVTRREVNEGELRGIYFQPPAETMRTTGVLVITGSDGGANEHLASLIASRGYPTLVLAYFAYADLPRRLADIPLEYFNKGASWLRSRVNKVGVIAISRGTEAAALCAVHFNGFADGLVLYVPSHIVEAGMGAPSRAESTAAWTLNGATVPFAPDTQEMSELRASSLENGTLHITPAFLNKWLAPGIEDRYGIPVERITVPILLLSGANDAIWPSWIAAARIESRIKASNPHSRLEHLCFQGAGHVIARPGAITSRASFMYHPHSKVHIALGGIPRVNAAAALTAFSRTLSFLATL